MTDGAAHLSDGIGYSSDSGVRQPSVVRVIARSRKRLPALDGLRGILSVVVVLTHIGAPAHLNPSLFLVGRIAVLMFFWMSALVLARAWQDGAFATFLARRAVRLWPAYAVLSVVGAASLGVPLRPADLFWGHILCLANPPAWSLSIEARAMLVFPLLVWAGRTWLRTLAVAAIWIALWQSTPFTGIGLAFLLGARMSRWNVSCALLERPIPQFLGKISYSLYLTHWPIIATCPLPVALVAVPAAAWACWWALERPSIILSRRVTGVMQAVGTSM